VLPLGSLPTEELSVSDAHVAGRDLPKAGDWRQLRYQGDWMRRPIASNEIGPLVRLLVALSGAINGALGLTGQPTPPGEEPPETILQVCVFWGGGAVSGAGARAAGARCGACSA
jgi:hypothetical protein